MTLLILRTAPLRDGSPAPAKKLETNTKSSSKRYVRRAKIIGQHKLLRSKIVKAEDGNHLRRNHSHLLLTREP